jgi:hypothetical protein
MNHTKEEILRIQKLLKKVIETATISHNEKNDIENVLTYLTGDNWKDRCLTCGTGQINLILKSYYDQLIQAETKEKETPPVVAVPVDTSNTDVSKVPNIVVEKKPKNNITKPKGTTNKPDKPEAI